MGKYVSDIGEELCGYFVSENKKNIWDKEIEILVEFMRVCQKNNLKFFVAHGTLLGAVRHKGFIPWDDDIDVNMPRADFEKLKKIALDEFKEPYFFQCPETDPGYVWGIAKLRRSDAIGMDIFDSGRKINNGLFIDIFPMDAVIENEMLRKEQSLMLEYYRGGLYSKAYGDNYRYFLQYPEDKWEKINKEFKKFTIEEIYERFLYWCTKYNGAPNIKREGILSFITDYECCYWYKEDYEELCTLKFESIDVPAPKNFDRCLKIKWNDYMKFPPINKMGNKHIDTIIDADIPYRDYPTEKFQITLDKSRRIIIFGAGKLCLEFLYYYKDCFDVQFIVDNNSELIGTDVNGIEVKDPNHLKEILEFDYEIIIASIYFDEIEKRLKNMGINNYKIYLPGKKLKGM